MGKSKIILKLFTKELIYLKWELLFTCKVVSNFVTPWTAACQASLSFTISQNLLKLKSIESVMPSNCLILSSPSPAALSLSQHQGLFLWDGSSYQVAKVLAFQHQFLKWIFRVDFLYWLVWSPCSPRDSQESSLALQFESINSSALSLLYGPTLCTWLLEKP